MIWDFIRDFIVEHITGGLNSHGESFACSVGNLWYTAGEESEPLHTNSLYFNLGTTGYEITLGDWLSTTITIVIMVLIVSALALLVRWVFKAVVNAFTLR